MEHRKEVLTVLTVVTVVGLASWRSNPFVLTPPGEPLAGSMGLGLTIAIWFYSGYESLSTMGGEIEEPQRVIPTALLISIPAVVAVYFLPTFGAPAQERRLTPSSEPSASFIASAPPSTSILTTTSSSSTACSARTTAARSSSTRPTS